MIGRFSGRELGFGTTRSLMKTSFEKASMKSSQNLATLVLFVLLCGCSREPLLGDFERPLTGGFRLRRESSDVVEVYHDPSTENLRVPGKVVEIAWNERVILVKQQHLKDRGKFQGDTVPIPVPGKFKVWIIDLAQTNRIGPLPEAEFQSKVNELEQEQLKLKNVSTLRHP